MAEEMSHKSYRPVTALSFRMNHILSGGLHPMGFHVVVPPPTESPLTFELL